MRTILALLALIALVSPMLAMPNDMMNDSSVCKIGMDTGSSMLGIFAWQNPLTHNWEVQIGTVTYKGVAALPITYYGDEKGLVEIDLT